MIWGWQDCSVVRSTWCGSLTGGVCSPAPVVGAGGGGVGVGVGAGGGGLLRVPWTPQEHLAHVNPHSLNNNRKHTLHL